MKRRERLFSIDYYAYKSPLRVWNPTFKILFVLAVLFFCLWADHMAVSLYIVLSMAVFNVCRNRVHPAEYAGLLAIPLAFIVMGGTAIAVEFGYGDTGFYLQITGDSLFKGLEVMLRAFGAVSAFYLLTLSTPAGEIVSALRSFHLPKVMIELMNMIYRYIFILMDTQCRIRNSAESRLGYADFQTSLITFGNSLGNLLILSLHKARMYYDAMEARCYDGELLFLEEEKPMRLRHAAAAFLYLAGLVGIKLFTERSGLR